MTNKQSRHLQWLGQESYRHKKYHAALDLFSSVIAQESKPPVSVFDHRAATYEKLGDLKAALKDGRRMISDYSTDCSGYLRTGKVLGMLEKDDVALDIYKYGMRKVPPNDPEYKLLREMHDTLLDTLSPRKAKDPLIILPVELARMVLGYLTFNQIVSLCRVSRSWRVYLGSMPHLWKQLDFSQATKNISKEAIRKYVRYARGNVDSVTLTRFVGQQKSVLSYLVTVCTKVERIEILNGYTNYSLNKALSLAANLKCLIVAAGVEIPINTIAQVLGHSTSLTHAEFHCVVGDQSQGEWTVEMGNLRSLTIKSFGDHRVRLHEAVQIVLRIPNIQNLSFENIVNSNSMNPSPDFSILSNLETLALVQFGSIGFPALPPSVRKLTIDKSGSFTSSRFSLLPASYAANLSHLTELSMSDNHNLHDGWLEMLVGASKGRLTKLNLNSCGLIEPDKMIELTMNGFLDSITDLHLNNTRADDEVVQILALRLHNLKVLSIASTRVTGIGVKALVSKPGEKLEFLSVRNCSMYNDAIVFARSQGIQVAFGRSSDSNTTGKKIRLI